MKLDQEAASDPDPNEYTSRDRRYLAEGTMLIKFSGVPVIADSQAEADLEAAKLHPEDVLYFVDSRTVQILNVDEE